MKRGTKPFRRFNRRAGGGGGEKKGAQLPPEEEDEIAMLRQRVTEMAPAPGLQLERYAHYICFL